MKADKLLTPNQAAALLGTTTQTLAKWRRDGAVHLPYVTYEGQLFYRTSDIQHYLEAQDDSDDEVEDNGPTEEDD
jgi:predicted site-specific integrase-resolvase